MKIAVCLKHVPDLLTVEVDPLSGTIDESRLLYVTNPADEAALELALRLRAPQDELLALTVGPQAAEVTLRGAIAVGATRGLRLCDNVPGPAGPPATATLLVAALRAEGLPDLLLCGARSTDRGTGQVPALLAELLGWPLLTDLTQVELDQGKARGQRRLARGAREEVEVALPAVLAVEPGLARLRQASLPGLLAAQRTPIPVLRANDLGLESGALQLGAPQVLATRPPRPRSRPIFTPASERPAHERIDQILVAGVSRKSGKLIEGPPDKMAAAILAFLAEHDS